MKTEKTYWYDLKPTDNNKGFIFITPKVANIGLGLIRKQFDFLNNKENISVICNDFGVLNVSLQYDNLRPHLGRQLIYIPARCPWENMSNNELGFLAKRKRAVLITALLSGKSF